MLEICAYNIQACRIAESAGAGRIELCSSPGEGGVTPSYGLIKFATAHINIPVYIMIRPRGGNFVYTSDELDIMYRDIATCKELGCKGIATGVLLPDGRIDTERMKQITQLAGPMKVTCHKAFDRTPDALQALEDVIASGCERILTSGLAPTAAEGAAVLAKLVQTAGDRIIIMPGGGVRSSNIAQLAAATGAGQYHSSGITAGGDNFVPGYDEIAAMATICNGLVQ